MNVNNTKPGDTKPIPEIVIPPLNDISNDGSVSIKLPSDATGVVTLTTKNATGDKGVITVSIDEKEGIKAVFTIVPENSTPDAGQGE